MSPLARLAPFFRPRRGLLALCVAGTLVSTALQLVGPWLVAQAIDDAIGRGDRVRLTQLAAAYFAVVVANLAVAWLSRVGIEVVAQEAMLGLKTRLFDHLVVHDQAFHDKHPSGRLMTRVQGDPASLQVLFTEVVLSAPADVALFLGMFAMLAARSGAIAAMVFAVVPPFLAMFWVFAKKSPPLFVATREVSARLTGLLAELLRAMPMLQRFDREGWARARQDALSAESQQKEVAAGLSTVVFFNSVFLVRGLGIVLVLLAGSALVRSGVLTVGALVMAMGYLRQMFNPLMRLSNNLGTVERARAAAVRIADILDDDAKIVDPPDPVAWPGLRTSLRFEGVSFAYGTVPVLEDVTIDVPAGARVALVGATGSGKSTLASLLLRFRDPVAGRVTVDGVDLRTMRIDDVRRRVGLVLQDVHLFPGTVLENLGGDALAARRACDALGVDLPLDHPVAPEGRNLSRGERQLLTFARALVRDPEILVLDEATSAVDPATEARVQRALDELQRGRTTVIVAHRLATVRDCDRIVVLSHGKVVEHGTHAELVARRGSYAALWQLQHGEAA